MDIYCENCGERNDADFNFCRNCGTKLRTPIVKANTKRSDDKNKVIILCLAGLIGVLAIATIFSLSAPLGTSGFGLKEYDFENFTMLVPADAEFIEYDSVGKGTSNWAIGYSSESTELATVWIGNYNPSAAAYTYLERDGDLEIYTGPYNSYMIQRNVGGYYFQILGTGELDDMKEMANSIELTDSP